MSEMHAKPSCLVTGAAGFIGSEVCRVAEQRGYVVTRCDPASMTMAYYDARRLPPIHFDLVVHCAAVVGGRRVMDWTPLSHALNVEIDAAVFQWVARTRPNRLVYFSSSCAYPADLGAWTGRALAESDIDLYQPKWPDQFYGWCKLTGELMADVLWRQVGVPVTVVRPFSVYGPGIKEGFAVRGFLDQIEAKADPFVVWGNLSQVRDYIHVTDVAHAALTAAECGINGPVNLGTGRATSLLALARMMTGDHHLTPKVDETMPAGYPWLVADPSRMRSFYLPSYELEEGLADMRRAIPSADA